MSVNNRDRYFKCSDQPDIDICRNHLLCYLNLRYCVNYITKALMMSVNVNVLLYYGYIIKKKLKLIKTMTSKGSLRLNTWIKDGTHHSTCLSKIAYLVAHNKWDAVYRLVLKYE